MRKWILYLIIVITMVFGGCKSSSDNYLSYENTVADSGFVYDSSLEQGEFFADDLAIVSEVVNVGGDDNLTAGTSLLVDITDKNILYADKVYDKLYPASLTKLLSALVVLRYGELTDMVTIGYNPTHITENGAKTCGFKEGDVITLEALLNSMLIYSGNDAAIAVAEHVGGTEEEFVKMMNEEALSIGAVHSNFVNANGLHDDNQYTTAYDLYLIFNELLEYDTFRSIINTTSYKAEYTDKDGNEKEKTFDTTNLYLEGEEVLGPGLDVVGGKTGTTSKAGNCLMLLSKDDSGKEYISIILKASNKADLYSQMTELLSKAAE